MHASTDCAGVPSLHHFCPGKPHLGEGMQGVCPWPPYLSAYEPGQGDRGPFGEDTGLVAATPKPCEWCDPPALGGVGCRGSGSTPETPGCLHHGRAPEVTRAVSSQKERFRAAEPPFRPPSRVPIPPGGPWAPGVCEEVRSGPRPWNSSSCRALPAALALE